MLNIEHYKDEEDLRYKVASHPIVIEKLALLAHVLGFGWCGGTRSQHIGGDFDVSKSGTSYILQARYNKNDPFSDGYWADRRLKITLSKFIVLIDPSKLSFAKPYITEMEPSTLSTSVATNFSHETAANTTCTASYQLAKTVTHSTNFSFTEGVKISAKQKVSIPFAESEISEEFSFSSTQGWTNSESTTESETLAKSCNVEVPRRSKVHVAVIVERTKSEVNYTGEALVEFDVAFEGFLRWSGNGRKDHPTNRPTMKAQFGSEEKHGLEDIIDQYEHRHIPGYSDWDWDWIEKNFPGSMKMIVEFLKGGIGTRISGKFKKVAGIDVHFNIGEAEPLPDTAVAQMAQVGIASLPLSDGELTLDNHLAPIPQVDPELCDVARLVSVS